MYTDYDQCTLKCTLIIITQMLLLSYTLAKVHPKRYMYLDCHASTTKCLYIHNPIMTNHTTTNVITCTCTV